MPVILATQEAEIRRIEVRLRFKASPGQIVCKILSQKKQTSKQTKNPSHIHKKRAGTVA
jgi:hypothetical protein